MTRASIPPALLILSLLWFACEAFFGGPVGVPDDAFRLAAGIMALVAAVGIAIMGVLDHVGGISNM